MNKKYVVSLSAAVLLSGCSSTLYVKHYPRDTVIPKAVGGQPAATSYSIANARKNPVYFLPETALEVKTSLKLVRQTTTTVDPKTNKSSTTEAYVAQVSKPITVAAISKRCDDLMFEVDYSEFKKFGVDLASLKLNLDGNGVLKGIGAESSDSTSTIVSNVISMVGTALKFAAVAGDPQATVKEEDAGIEVSFSKIYSIREFSNAEDGAGRVTFVVPDSDMQVAFPSKTKDGNVLTITDYPDISLTLSEAAKIALLSKLYSNGLGVERTPGVVLGLPGTAMLLITAGSSQSTAQPIDIACLNGLQIIPIGHRKFNKSSTAVSVDPALGSLTELVLKSDSVGANVTGLGATTFSSLKTLRDDLVTAEDLETVRVAKAESGALDALKGVLASQKALESERDPVVVETALLNKEKALAEAQAASIKAQESLNAVLSPDQAAQETARLNKEKALLEAQAAHVKAQQALDAINNDPAIAKQLAEFAKEKALVDAKLALLKSQEALAAAEAAIKK